MQLRDYQRQAIDSVWAHLRAYSDNPCVELPTGAGKSVVMAGLIKEAVTTWAGTRIAVLAHVRELVAQNADKLLRSWTSAPLGIYSASLGKRDRFAPVLFASIQSTYNRAMELGRFDLILVDEAHRIPIKGEGMYRRFLDDARRANPDLRVVGFTATPYRLGTGPVCGPDYILNRVCYRANVRELIEAGYLCRLVSKGGIARADLTDVHVRGGEYVASELEAAVNRADLVSAAVDEIVRYCADRRAWILFCASVKHATAVSEALHARGIEAPVVEGNTSSHERAEIIRRYQRGELRALCNVNVLSEGFDAPHVDAVILLRPTKSAGLYYQQCLDSKTEILTRAGWKRIGEVGLHDQIAAADYRQATPLLRWETPLEVIARPLGDEAMYEISGPGVDMRLTAGHAIILKGRKEKNWKREAAAEASARLSDYRIPVVTVESVPAAPLTDDEIRFIGWFMTDGNRNKHNDSITISQSSGQPWFQEIEKMLVGCGFKYSKRLITTETQFNESAPRYTFIVSKGAPRGSGKHLSGWGRLERWLSKDFAPALEALDARQFGVLLEAIHLGDGSKQAGQDWVRRSYHVATVNRTFADRLQSMCVRRGWRCNIGQSDSRGTEMLSLHIKAQAFRAIGGASQQDRASLRKGASDPAELVWCVTVPSGAFIARRNGKAFITGNCGRGLRTDPRKQDCLVLDFAGNIHEHGPIDSIRVEAPRKRGEKATVVGAPTKQCPGCQSIVLAALAQCPDCGHEWPRALARHDAQASDAPILSVEDDHSPWISEHPVTAITYHKHEKAGGGIPSLRVDYHCGMRTFREWVCLEHGGPVRARAVDWWRARAPADIAQFAAAIPRTVDGALLVVEHLRRPASIRVLERGRYPEILSHELEPDPKQEGRDGGGASARAGHRPGAAGEHALHGL